MKINLTRKQINDIVADPEKAQEAGVKISDPWWVIVLKVMAYIVALIMGGVVTTSCVNGSGALMVIG